MPQWLFPIPRKIQEIPPSRGLVSSAPVTPPLVRRFTRDVRRPRRLKTWQLKRTQPTQQESRQLSDPENRLIHVLQY